MHTSTITAIVLMIVASSLLAGCSISYSTGKSSDSISTSSDSISASSDSKGNGSAAAAANNYAEDVTAATAHYASSQKDGAEFLQIISNIARSHGIVDWEQDKLTYTAMGQGLKQAGIDEQTIAKLSYFHTLSNRANYLLVLEGYHQS